jgi:hypothetical protein
VSGAEPDFSAVHAKLTAEVGTQTVGFGLARGPRRAALGAAQAGAVGLSEQAA